MVELAAASERNMSENLLDEARFDPLGDLDQRAALHQKRFRSAIARAMFEKVIASVDRETYKAIQLRHAEAVKAGNAPALNKFLDVPVWVRAHALAAERIGLLSMRPGRVLDIGSGGGHLLAVCKAYGHEPMGIDVPNALYSELFRMYGIARFDEGVTYGKALPEQVGRHDAIIATGVTFDYHWNKASGRFRERWTLEEWAGFLEYLSAKHLNSPGMLYLHVNRGGGRESPFFEPLFRLCESAGAEVEHDRGRARFMLDAPLKFEGIKSVWNEPAP
jgi:protein-L-isoaspartate O-methyltransferase